MNTQCWLDQMETLLSQISAYWDGLLVITGDMNIDMKKQEDVVTKKYQSLLDVFDLIQIVSEPTRTTESSSTIIDHIITNDQSKITRTGIIPCSIVSDHDGPYACINIRSTRFEPRFKYIRNMKTFDADAFLKDCSVLPFNIINCFDDPDDQVSCMNKLFRECIEQHAPLRKIKVTRPPAPWLNNDEIRHLQNCRNKLRKEAHSTGSDKAWQLFRDARNKLKTLISDMPKCVFIAKLYHRISLVKSGKLFTG